MGDHAFDFLGNPILEGSLIVYANNYGRTPRLTLAEVLKVTITPTPQGSKFKFKVRPLADSYGFRWSNRPRYDAAQGKWIIESEANAVTLQHRDRLMVIT